VYKRQVFHLAAQPLVRVSYKNPIETYETNVIGTLKVFEACRKNNVKAIVNITSDKAYENKEWIWGYRENDPMGGYDPYSSSKGCADLLATSYRNSYFNLNDYKKTHNTLLATCRAGNVIGGGDWAQDRLVPDIIKAVQNSKKVEIRNPNSIRPWQHVLEPLSGYLSVGQKLLEGKKEFAEAWNFGPFYNDTMSVKDVIENIKTRWYKVDYIIKEDKNNLHEANLLKLDSSKAYFKLGWNLAWDTKIAFEKTIEWYKEFYENDSVISGKQLKQFINCLLYTSPSPRD
jgi:CDP-glucose 4,6-dehydratase